MWQTKFCNREFGRTLKNKSHHTPYPKNPGLHLPSLSCGDRSGSGGLQRVKVEALRQNGDNSQGERPPGSSLAFLWHRRRGFCLLLTFVLRPWPHWLWLFNFPCFQVILLCVIIFFCEKKKTASEKEDYDEGWENLPTWQIMCALWRM